jgi:hypothetical protein
MSRDNWVYLGHMLDMSQKALELTLGVDKKVGWVFDPPSLHLGIRSSKGVLKSVVECQNTVFIESAGQGFTLRIGTTVRP